MHYLAHETLTEELIGVNIGNPIRGNDEIPNS